MNKIQEISASQIIGYLNLKVPYGIDIIRPNASRDERSKFTEAQWDAFAWNPPDGYQHPDPDASPKPTWDELVAGDRNISISSSINNVWYELRIGPDYIPGYGASKVRRELTDETAIKHGDTDVHVGQGMDHLTGLIHLTGDADLAGCVVPPMIMRDKNQRSLNVHTQAEIKMILGAVSRRENTVESAHNKLMERLNSYIDIAEDESQSLDDRELAADTALNMAKNYRNELLAEIEKYDPDALPADLPTLKAVLTERLEAFTMARVKEIKGARTQQGVDVPAACFDMATALEEVSAESALGVQNIDGVEPVLWKRAGTTWVVTTATPANVEHEGPGAPLATLGADGEYYQETGVDGTQAAFNNAVGKIEAVTPLNVPEWVVTLPSGSSTTVAATAVHPAGQNIPGRVQITLWRGLDGDGAPIAWRPIIRRAGNAGYWEADIPAGTKYPVTINLSARNLCGPSSKKIIVPAPA